MENEEIKRLKKEIGGLKLEVAKIHNTLKMESDSTTKHIGSIYKRIAKLDDRCVADLKYLCQHIANLHDIIDPIEQKIFPNAKAARKKIAAIVGPKRLGAGNDLDKKKS
jgi:hypothetical protein